MAAVDELTKRLGALNTILAYYKYTDDIADENRGRVKRLLFKKGYKKAKKAYPELEEIVRNNLEKQQEREKEGVASVDIAADSTANMLAEISDLLLADKKSEFTHNLFYAIGKWIYLVDALDDYDKDVKKGLYNPFVKSYGAKCKAELIQEKEEEIRFIFHSLFYDIRENLSYIRFPYNRDLTDNILLRGLPAQTEKMIKQEACKSCKNKKEQA